MTGMGEESFMIFLSLEDINQISALNRNTRYVLYFVFSLLFMIWGIWNLKILLVSGIVYLHETKLRETVLKTDTV